ncbi:ATP-binding protein [Sphingobacterium sp. N143]|uniref:ATP-binding protein n=1 Tax=Sphingobacterium sp. N143 TaxID=2746727 RepID=UPI00257693CD|nr:ATP-binding protein [Sphingobacterium sp. N143]MDM1295097.1 ATP-binding protein [Sphingobacterium sp. N143]
MDVRKELIKIAVVGPESTGKSTMAQFLAKKFQTPCVPEYSRYYCQSLNNKYTLQDEVNMFYGQIALEEALIPLAKGNILICDTTCMTVKIWSDHLFGHTPKEVTDKIRQQHYDFYLLMDIDLAWQDDPLRDFPEQRDHFMEVWKKELYAIQGRYHIVSGQGDQRLANGLSAVQDFLTLI